jgi:hypothetical protein
LYLRVSTSRQAEADLSIPDQRRQAMAFCAARGWDVAIEFVEPGASGTDDRRPELQRLLDMATAASDPTLKERVAAVKTERDIAQVALDRAAAEMRSSVRITDEKIAAFVEIMRTKVLSGDTPFRRAYIRSVIDQVEVDDTEIRIFGRRTVLERLVMGGGAAPAGVPSFVRKWRARKDSNL